MKRDKLITHYEAVAALQRLINSRFNQTPGARCSIPAGPDDDDVLISDYLEQMKPVDMTVLANHTKWHALCSDPGVTDPNDTPADTVLAKLNEKQEQYATEKTAGLQRDLAAARRISIINAQAREIVNLRQEDLALQGRNNRQAEIIGRLSKTIEELACAHRPLDCAYPQSEAKTRVIVLTDNSGKTAKEVADLVREAVQK